MKWDKLFKGGDDDPPEGWPPPSPDTPPRQQPDPMWEDWRPPVPGEVVPPGNFGLQFRPPGETQREVWETRHTQWLQANGLSCPREELRAWWDNPARDNIPVPGLMDWQRMLVAQERSLDGVLGGQLQVPLTGPPRDTARDVARIEWLENALTRAATELAENGTERDRLLDHVAWQERTIRQQAGLIEQRKAETEQLRSELVQNDATVRRQQSAIDDLNAKLKAKDSAIGRQDTAIEQHIAATGRERARAGELSATIDRQNAQLGEKAAEIERRQAVADKLTAEIERKNAKIEDLESELLQRQARPGPRSDAAAGDQESSGGQSREERMIERQQARIAALESRIRELTGNDVR